MDAFISSHITGVPNARIKCRTNYRYLFELVKYLPTSNPEINTERGKLDCRRFVYRNCSPYFGVMGAAN